MEDADLIEFLTKLDTIIAQSSFEPHIIAAMLLSRVTHLTSEDPTVGKQLVQYVLDQLDQIERGTQSLLDQLEELAVKQKFCYTYSMKPILAALFLVHALSGCAVISVASGVSYIATDKTLTDHAVTLAVPNAQCSSSHVFKGLYYCELTPVYNTSGL